MRIEVFTDGSATTRDKPGGYGWVITLDGKFHSEGSGSIPNATNNDAELEGAIVGLGNVWRFVSTTPHPDVWPDVTLVSDSQIVLGWLNGTYRFKQTSKKTKFEILMRLKGILRAKGRWVEGHTGDEWNERADKLAGLERRKAMGIVPKKSSKSALMLQTIKEIAKVASAHDTGQREYGMSDWDYVMKQCEKVLKT